jgi:hypothetical protein
MVALMPQCSPCNLGLLVVPPALRCRSCNRQLLRWESVCFVMVVRPLQTLQSSLVEVGSVVAVPAICQLSAMVVIAADPAVDTNCCCGLIAADPAVDLDGSVCSAADPAVVASSWCVRCRPCSRRDGELSQTLRSVSLCCCRVAADPAVHRTCSFVVGGDGMCTPVLPSTPVVCSATASLLALLALVVVEAGTSCSLASLPCWLICGFRMRCVGW